MVSEDSPSNSNSSILHQFIISTSIANQNHFGNQHFDAYGTTDSVSNSPYPHSLPLSIQFLGDRISRSVDLVHHAPQLSDDSDIGHDRRLMDLLGRSTEAAQPAQRLSLSLGSVPCRQRPLNSSLLNPSYLISGEAARESCNLGIDRVINDYSFTGTAFTSLNQSCSTSYGTESFAAAIGSSKYLKPAQSILEEMVERRYEEYYHHMEELVSSFEVIAGLGAGKSYTALALQAMSKHFCSLRNAIVSQIRATKQKIEKEMPKISSRLSQLSLFDQEARQNRISLQQLGLMHNSRQAWRPIRGLPETSVTILRAWLFEHFLHPYPNDSEKLMLASQTGLSKNQVSNWFINARVRLWKPMIEEMYKEEFADSSTESDQLLTREGVGDSAEDLN
ncbi:UNVERIFIED_CONTAM: BEL1-like homeodomain protein 11 [Sesamum radiatum]|uniref:BEL1-like homeodomain protein 11 n=1 Tax=Sesamum radiatum TaxID=300843 RepID=A0AAW2M464_SESRA